MTSNVGARDLAKRSMGFGDSNPEGADTRAYERLFSPEFRNRLDARVAFHALSEDIMLKVVDKFIAELQGQLDEKKVSIELSEGARIWLAKKGHDPEVPAQPKRWNRAQPCCQEG